jgi:Ca-activated chloride channel family protein
MRALNPSSDRIRPLFLSLAACAAAIFSGCGPTGGGGGDVVGVSPGGQEDIAQARRQIEQGYLPEEDDITIEGFLSEHDIPLAQPENAPELYASLGLAWRVPFGEPAPMGDLFLSFGTTIDLNAFERPPLNLAVVVDRSGSMARATDDPYGHRSTYYFAPPDPFEWLIRIFNPAYVPPPGPLEPSDSKLAALKIALNRLVDQLGPDDVLTLISFNETTTLDAGPMFMSDKSKASDAIARLRPYGGTNIYNAMEAGYRHVRSQRGGQRLDRVILMTDALPNVGPQGTPEFVNLVAQHAADGIGFTLMGVGMDFGAELAREISAQRGGNAFYLADEARIASIFDEDFKFQVTPAAYDVRLDVTLPPEVGIREVFGVGDYLPGTRGATVHVPTLFFSRREGGGAIVVRLTTTSLPPLDEDVTFGSVTLSYRMPSGELRTQTLPLTLPAGVSPEADPPYYSEPELRRAALLLDTAVTLRKVVRLARTGNGRLARETIDAFLAYFDENSVGLSDRVDPTSRGLSDERRLLERLRGAIWGG